MNSPNGFAPLLDLELFMDLHSVPAGPDPGPGTPRQRICRLCASEVMLWGLRDWWLRERSKGNVSAAVLERPNCVEGRLCQRQKDTTHARECEYLPCPFACVLELNTICLGR
jgi:E3 ubiquitin-protein ligase CHFR